MMNIILCSSKYYQQKQTNKQTYDRPYYLQS